MPRAWPGRASARPGPWPGWGSWARPGPPGRPGRAPAGTAAGSGSGAGSPAGPRPGSGTIAATPRTSGHRPTLRKWPPEAGWVTGLTLTEAQDLLDWLENHGCTGLEVSCPEGTAFAVRCVCPPGLRLGRDQGGQVCLFKD